ncbi:ferrous iron transporter B [Heliorestis convoluta]|uniref:Ferrous iron transport protein B n=1 Tax=Heliorestis convoluta TaxID=356322 RepID=A0A5Q2N1P8_9FIRM|nr:ferrous iron transporter B [Heliorestis convoluta]QGG48928.1 ferrous iron transport protein B [Heliorestis convoluta]
MSCHDLDGSSEESTSGERKFLLVGNPNVGKSVIFSKLTGKNVMASNYAGTTVSMTEGTIHYQGTKSSLVDLPGIYSLEASSPAEEVAVKVLEAREVDAILFVLDATGLEKNLPFAYQILGYGIPVVFALNLLDVAKAKGIQIDINRLEKELGAPVISTIAVRHIGLKEILQKLHEVSSKKKKVAPSHRPKSVEEYWSEANRVSQQVQKVTEPRQSSFLDRLSMLSLQLLPGTLIALIVLCLSVAFVVGGGKALRSLILLPLVNDLYIPWITQFMSQFMAEGIWLNVLVGEYGMLVKGIEWPFALILPYVFLFYIVLSVLEDTGYLPHLGVLVDGLLRRIGIQGSNIVPFIMGYGCAIPAILGSRAATTYRERVILATIVSLAVPCIAQTGAFIALLGEHSAMALIFVYLLSFLAILFSGMLLNKSISGKSDPLLVEIPHLLLPNEQALMKKIYLRTKSFMIEAEIPMILAIGVAALLVETGLLNALGIFLQPLVVTWLGLPQEASIALILGVIRREIAVLPLLEMNLTTLQMVVGSVVALFYLPCLSAFAVLTKEFRLKLALAVSLSTIVVAFFVGGLIHHIGKALLPLLI